MTPRAVLILHVVAFSLATVHAGSRSSADYSIPTDTIDAGGTNATSTNYSLRGSAVGQSGAGATATSTSASYLNKPGYAGQLSDLLTLAASRLTHSGAGPFEIDLPLSGMVGVECRSSSIYTVVFTFASTLSSVATVNATATGVVQPGPSSGMIDPTDAHRYIASLTSLPNGQFITVTLGNVNDSDGNVSSSVPVVAGLLLGDTSGNGIVNATDVGQTKSQSGQATTGANFRQDVTPNGTINASDIGLVKSRSGQSLP